MSELPRNTAGATSRRWMWCIAGISVTVIAVVTLLPAWVVRKTAEAYSIEQLRSVRDGLRLYVEHGGTMPAGPEWHLPLLQQGYVSPGMLQPPRANMSCEVCVGYVDGLTEASLRERGIDPATQLWMYEIPACVDGDELAVMTFDGTTRLAPRAEVVAWIERVHSAAK